jgi:glycosyltransferase involved in cell wall biosynthesis
VAETSSNATARPPGPPTRIGTAVVDAQVPLEDFDFSGAEHWHVLVLDDGLPVARVELPSPGATAGTALAEAVLLRHADPRQAEAALIESLRQRLGATAERPDRHLGVSVVVCTHRRPDHLTALLASLAGLEPAPAEVIIVDNAPGEEDCRDQVLAAGFRYVREDRRGLDNARNAGARAARGEILAFTDDDCVLPAAWLAPLDELFAHEGVAAVSGPAFPYRLDTPSQIRMERQASLARGLRRVVYDFQEISPLHASGIGVGANMAIRREHLIALGPEPFPPELDAGTASESGGDMYALAKLLLAGHRIVYEPRSFVFHQHRSDAASLRRAVFGYGVGLTAALTKFVVEEGEATAGRVWLWLVRQYLVTQRRRIVGRADAVETLISWEYLRGGLHGARRWRQALAVERIAEATALAAAADDLRPSGDGPEAVTAPAPGPAPGSRDDDPQLTVIVPTFKRPGALRRCLDALAAQDVTAEAFEVVVVDDDPEASAAAELAGGADRPFDLRVEPNPGRGPAAARNHGVEVARGAIVLFLDDDVVPGPSLVRRHLEWHARRERSVLVGPALPAPAVETLIAAAARLWWQDFFRLLSGSLGSTFFAALTGNTSTPRALWLEVGGLDTGLSKARREDWEWGLRLLAAGASIDFDREAWARHEFVLGTEARLSAAGREGTGDALIAASHEGAAHALPLASLRPVEGPRRRLGLWLWRQDRFRASTVLVLDVLERTGLREAWMRLFRSAQATSYALGAIEAGWRPEMLEREVGESVTVELDGDVPIPAPGAIPPELRLTAEGGEVARLRPLEGLWSRSLAEQIVAAIPGEIALRIASREGWIGDKAESHRRAAEVEVILGPANPESDAEGLGAIEDAGAIVEIAGGEVAGHWRAVREAAAAGERPLIAIPLPGTRPTAEWLQDALVAFDGDRVGLAYGGFTAPGVPPEPLYLQDAASADFALGLHDQVPTYLIMRRELLDLLVVTGPELAPLLGVVEAARAAGWVVGHRNCRGLVPPLSGERDRGEAFGYLEGRKIGDARGAARRRAIAAGGVRVAASVAWMVAQERGRVSPRNRARARAIARGVLRGLTAGRHDRSA